MKRPNVILISIDTLRADHLSCYGYQKKTSPNIDRIASEGTIFRQNYSTAVWTPPGHASMLTGLYMSEHGVHGEQPLLENIPTVAEKLRENGYQTAGFVNNSQVGELVGLHRGHDLFVEVWKGTESRWIGERLVKGLLRRIREKLGLEDMGAERTNMLFRDWLEKYVDREKPIYAFVHYIEVHNPLNPPRPYKAMYMNKPYKRVDMAKIKKVARNPLICFAEDLTLNKEEIEFIEVLYDGEIAYTDSKIGEVVGMLKKKKLFDDTMILITSDHGEHLGEHGMWSHVASLHDEILRVPLIIKYPKGIECCREVNEYTQIIDIFPTIMEVAGVSRDDLNTSGISLVQDKSRGNQYHKYVFADWEGRVPYFIQTKMKEGEKAIGVNRFNIGMSMIQDNRWKYIMKSDGTEEMYDLLNKEEEIQDMESRERIRDRFRSELSGRKKTMEGQGKDLPYSVDKEIERNLKALGYM
jgi:arylsulfatase A-like enzyme